MKYTLLTIVALTLGGCMTTQPEGRRQGDGYIHQGTDVTTLGDYGVRPGTSISNGIVQWDINWEVK